MFICLNDTINQALQEKKMSGTDFLSINSEIGKLNAVLLHRPGKELERLTPAYLEEMLFDDIPWLKRIQYEHDQFAAVLMGQGTEVYYYTDLLSDILKDSDVRYKITEDIVSHAGIHNAFLAEEIKAFLKTKSAAALSEIFIAGLSISDLPGKQRRDRLSFYIQEAFPFYISPLINFYFTRDPGAVIGNRLSVHSMKREARRRESLILQYIYTYHEYFKETPGDSWYHFNESASIEGGDILVLNEQVVAIGCSVRTSTDAIEQLSGRLFKDSRVREVLVIQIPFTRAYMHLDTVFTMVDYDKFTIFPGIEESVKVFSLTPGSGNSLRITPKESLRTALKSSLGLPAVNLIPSGGGDVVTAAREQWNDSTNTLAVAPGVVITYERNAVSNRTLRENGIDVVEIEGSELVRGRGGPRCMSMPLHRDSL